MENDDDYSTWAAKALMGCAAAMAACWALMVGAMWVGEQLALMGVS